MAKTVFAIELVKTSQGYVEPACPLAALDMPEDELMTLHEEGKVVSAEHDSPLAARAHEIRRSGEKSTAVAFMREAANTLSPDSPADAPTDPEPETKPTTETPTEPASTEPS